MGGARAENIGRAAVALTGQKERWKIFAAKLAGCWIVEDCWRVRHVTRVNSSAAPVDCLN